ncbi:hypothetical protein [Streptomyces sp. NBC_00076]|uniref:hypothetical protein n=1 Tax=Streptomyces sp. NBC_00076 TaxID=2975642 RepID=UPI00324B540C
MAALPVRFSALRMLALCGRTVIVDEVHALPPFMRQTLSRLLHWLGAVGCPAVLLSATLPGEDGPAPSPSRSRSEPVSGVLA